MADHCDRYPRGHRQGPAARLARENTTKPLSTHENAAQAHRVAAQNHGKGDHANGWARVKINRASGGKRLMPDDERVCAKLYEVLENGRIRRLNQTTALAPALFIGSRRALRVMSLAKRQARAQRRSRR